MEGVFLRETGRVSAMMDISDGLATDLRHILKQSGVGAVLEAKSIPVVGSFDEALYGGEDFELLFTVPPEDAENLTSLWRKRFQTEISMIGCITDETSVLKLRNGKEILVVEGKAFEHFSGQARGGCDE